MTTAESNATFMEPIAEPLVRYRRHPPRTIVKHIIRPKRVKVKRLKKPKIKYSFAEPPTTIYYKKTKPSYSHGPTYDSSIFEDFSHINVESADFDLPPSSYETHSMDFDLYKHYESQAEQAYKEIEKPSYSYSAPEVSYKEMAKIPSYSYSPPKGERKPHTQYGVPTEFTYSTGYDKPSVNSYSYEEGHLPEKMPSFSSSSHGTDYGGDYHAPSSYDDHSNKISEHASAFSSTGYDEKSHGSGYGYQEEHAPSYPEHSSHPQIIESGGGHDSGHHGHDYSYQAPKEEYNYSPPQQPAQHPPRIPATKYGVPDLHLPVANFNNYNKYSVADHKPSSSYNGYNNQHHFAEPPDPQKTTVEITYSPSYEINLPPRKAHYHPAPPPPPPPEHSVLSYHPEHGHQEGSDSHQPARYEPAPPQDLPIDQNHQQPPYDYPKSSYEVPIYDPIPFDSSSHQEQEVYPPQPYDNNSWQEDTNTEYAAEPNNVSEQKPSDTDSQEMPHGDVHSAGTRSHGQSTFVTPPPIQRPQGGRKRKRTKGSQYHSTTLATTKHILDVPELEEAFEKEKQKENKYLTTDPDINESHKVVKVNNGPWNPMRIRTPTISGTTPSTTLAINQYSNHHGNRNSYQNRYRSTTTTSTTTMAPPRHQHHRTRPSAATTQSPPLLHQQTSHLPKIEIVSIEKSRSKTFYDGILSTPKIYNTNFLRNRYRTVQQHQSTSTIAPHLSGGSQSSSSSSSSTATMDRFSKRTTKNFFDTTIFKSPLNEPDVYRNLPKNHKLF